MDQENQDFFKNGKNTSRFYHFTNINGSMMYGFSDMECKTEFFVILDHFLPFYPPNNPKNLNFEKMKKLHQDIIILHMCTINDNHMMYGS